MKQQFNLLLLNIMLTKEEMLFFALIQKLSGYKNQKVKLSFIINPWDCRTMKLIWQLCWHLTVIIITIIGIFLHFSQNCLGLVV